MSEPFNDNWATTSIPYSQEAEEAALGAPLINHNCFADMIAFLRADDFYVLRHKYIYEAYERLYKRKEPIDYLTVTKELGDLGTLGEVGGLAYLSHLSNSTPTSWHWEIYARIVQRTAIRRRLMIASDHIKGLALNGELTIEQVINISEQKLMDVTNADLGKKERGLSIIISEVMDYVEQRMDNPGILPGIPFGYTELDELLLGAEKGNLAIFAGIPGSGKTALLLCILLNMARLGARVGFLSYEMTDTELMQRLLSLESAVNLKTIRSGAFEERPYGALPSKSDEFGRFTEAAKRLSLFENNIFLYEGHPTISGIKSKALSWKREKGLDVLIVDYIQIIQSDTHFENRATEVGNYAYNLKYLGQDLNIPMLVGCQVNREVFNRKDKRPKMSDLRESGVLEQAADKLVFVHRPECFDDDEDMLPSNPNEARLYVEKHRNGPTGMAELYFEKTLAKFMNGERREIDLGALGGYDARYD